MSSSAIVSNLQNTNPSAIIELFTLQLDNSLHGATTVYRFHNGSSLKDNGEIVWAGNSYQRFPIKAEGFQYGKGQLPRPTLTVSNALGTITAILLNINTTTAGNDLTGATVTRIRTLARFLDAVNFPSNVNPYGTPDATAEFPQEIYKIDRKAAENRDLVQFELASVFDLAGIRAPKRQCTRSDFPSIGTFNG
jgi:lambda family phage minor tail protein L|nr:phage minor tail protein L [uncultured Mediterranean phage uvMED]BAR38945.1 phage minor tail protein L [uncultured Mediterranean phage uvMED]